MTGDPKGVKRKPWGFTVEKQRRFWEVEDKKAFATGSDVRTEFLVSESIVRPFTGRTSRWEHRI
jgi:hypothetical protein